MESHMYFVIFKFRKLSLFFFGVFAFTIQDVRRYDIFRVCITYNVGTLLGYKGSPDITLLWLLWLLHTLHKVCQRFLLKALPTSCEYFQGGYCLQTCQPAQYHQTESTYNDWKCPAFVRLKISHVHCPVVEKKINIWFFDKYSCVFYKTRNIYHQYRLKLAIASTLSLFFFNTESDLQLWIQNEWVQKTRKIKQSRLHVV